jgi:F-type H+-transporting ATPase subunit delta
LKGSKEAVRIARQLLRLSFQDGKVDADRVKRFTKKIAEDKPRGYLTILNSYQQMMRLELEKKHAIIESAEKLSDSISSELKADLQKKYGEDMTIEYKETPALMGGMRVRVGSDVWDGSVKARLETLSNKL